MSNIIDKIQVSGVTYGIKSSGGTETIELTQAQYDALVDKDPNVFYIITDAQAGDLTNYYTKTETDNAITAATSTKQDTLVSSQNIKTINNESLLGSGNIDIQGGGSSYTAGDGIDITNDVISVTGKVSTSDFNTYTAATDTALASKQTTLTAGTNITIVDNVISAEGGGSITIDPSLDSGSTNPVANSAITTSVNEKQFKRRYVGCGDGDAVFLSTDSVVIDGKTVTIMKPMFRGYANNSTNTGLELQNVNLGLYFTTINGKNIFNTSKNGNWITEVIETSAITTSVTSSSTDAQVPSAKAVYDIVGNIETLLSQI